MGSYNTAVITTVGQALLTSVLGAQGTMTFTKLQTSSYSYASGTDLSALTSLNNVEQEVNVGSATIVDSTHISASATISNSGISTEYNVNTLGIFASDGVNEVLFAVSTAVTPDVIPVDSGGTPSTYKYNFTLAVSSTSDITISAVGDITANDVSFDNTTSGLPATDVQTAIDDIDAEVDDVVNVYGSKNLFPVKAISQTIDGVTFTQNSDGSITITGTPNNPVGYSIGNGDNWNNYDLEWLKDLNGKTLEISGVADDAESGIQFVIALYNAENQQFCFWSTSTSASRTAVCNTNGAVYYQAYLYVHDTTKNYNVTIYPMLRLASIPDSTYEPYSMTNQQITKRLSGQSNENLMDNPWFTINQRGFTSASLETGYTVDRWRYDRSNDGSGYSCEYTSSGIHLSSGTGTYVLIAQKLEDELISSLIGKTVTFSLMTSTGLIYSGTWVFDGSDHAIFIDIQGKFSADYSVPYYKGIRIICHGPNAPTFRAVKLELGSESTLAYDVAPDYGEELAKCQRYFVKTDSGYVGAYGNTQDTSSVNVVIPVPVPMAGNPVVTGNFQAVFPNTGVYTLGSGTLSFVKRNNNTLVATVPCANTRTTYDIFLVYSIDGLSISCDL
jgi:hypothetical protein